MQPWKIGQPEACFFRVANDSSGLSFRAPYFAISSWIYHLWRPLIVYRIVHLWFLLHPIPKKRNQTNKNPLFSCLRWTAAASPVPAASRGDGSGSSDDDNAQMFLISTWYTCRQRFVVSELVILHPPMIHRTCTTLSDIYMWLSHVAGIHVDITLVLLVLSEVW